ncbi:MAG: protein translocase subunit SecD, partial [Mycobacterium sp.]
MASPSAPVHPSRYLAVFLVLLIGVYLLVFLTGNKHADPKLGIDLQGGTRVTLTARTPDGSRPTREALSQAQQIIGSRVNGLGVSGSEVIVDGDNLVITVPGTDGNEARNLGQTARLFIRPVINALPVDSTGMQGGPRLPAPRGTPRLPNGQVPGAPGPGGAAPGAPAPGPRGLIPKAPSPGGGPGSPSGTGPGGLGGLPFAPDEPLVPPQPRP